MKSFLLRGLALPLLLLLTGFSASAQTWHWATRAGSPDHDWIEATATDANGNVYVIGNFSGRANIYGTLLTSAGGTDVFVAKLLSVGIWDWAVQLGSRGDDYAGDIVVAGGNVYVTGSFADTTRFGPRTLISDGGPDVFVAKLSAGSGAWLWGVRAGGPGHDEGAGLAVNSSGTVFVTGQFGGATARFGTVNLTNAGPAGTTDAFLGRLAAGTGVWQGAIRAGGTGSEVLGRTVLDSQGALLVLGAFDSPTVAFSSNITVTNAGSGTTDAFVAKLPATGTSWQWVTRLGGANHDVARDLITDAARNAYVTGWFGSDSLRLGTSRLANAGAVGTTDAFMAKISPTGAWQWGTRAGSPADETSHHMVADGTDLLIAGELGGTIDAGRARVTNVGPAGTTDLYVARLTNTGTWIDVVRAGGLGDERPGGLVATGGGTVVVTGAFDGPSLAFGGISLANNDPTGATTDFFAAQLDARLLNAVPADLPAAAGFDLWPNPAHEVVHLTGLPAEGATVQIIDALGHTVYTSSLAPHTSHLDLTGLPAGVYFVRSGERMQRLVVE